MSKESKLIEPSAGEVANGWSRETLTAYLNERHELQQAKLDWNNPSRRQRPDRQGGHRWNFPARRSWTRSPSWRR
jgi:hypothetical protein